LPTNRPTSAHRQKRSERSTSIGGCHDHELWINFPGMRRDFRALLRCNLGVLVCGTVAGSERPASVNQFCSVGLRWLDAEVETAADPAIRVSISRSARGGAAVCAVSMGLRQGRGGKARTFPHPNLSNVRTKSRRTPFGARNESHHPALESKFCCAWQR
jgi:hypothetical protein